MRNDWDFARQTWDINASNKEIIMKVQRPFLAIVALTVFVSMACKFFSGLQATATPAASPTPQATRTARPTETAQATEESIFFTEEFDTDPKWDLVIVADSPPTGQSKSDPESVVLDFSDSSMIFKIPESWLSVFYTYTEETYKDVRLDIEFDNRGVNSQQISMACRSDLGDKSYELEVGNDGKWVFKVNRRIVSNGGSVAIKTGKGINQYTMICKGNEISFFFNGVEPKGSPYTDTQTALGPGHIGLVVTSKRAVPVDIAINWYKISEP